MVAYSELRQRRPELDFSTEMPRYWYGGDPFLTLYWATLSALFPEGERFFVRSVRHFLDQVDEAALKAAVSGFIGQEAMHTKEHAALNAAMSQLGVDAERIDRELRPILRGVERLIGPRRSLAVTCALEHFTATMAEQLLRETEHQAQGHPAVMNLWFWHALEESEHKAVAFDVYRKAKGTNRERIIVMMLTTCVFFALTAWWHTRLLARDRTLWPLHRHLRAFLYLYGPRGIFARILPQYLAYYRPSFHPNDVDATALLTTWRARLFGPGGLLVDRAASRPRRSAEPSS